MSKQDQNRLITQLTDLEQIIEPADADPPAEDVPTLMELGDGEFDDDDDDLYGDPYDDEPFDDDALDASDPDDPLLAGQRPPTSLLPDNLMEELEDLAQLLQAEEESLSSPPPTGSQPHSPPHLAPETDPTESASASSAADDEEDQLPP